MPRAAPRTLARIHRLRYGYAYACTSTSASTGNCSTATNAAAITFADAQAALARGCEYHFDHASASPMYECVGTAQTGGSRVQGWFDDGRSTLLKYQYAASRGLGGTGCWTSDDAGSDGAELWAALAAYLAMGVPPVP